MKFVPFRLFRFLHPVDIQKNINTHFEQTLKELTAQNSEYHREIIQLGNRIIQLSGELEETKQESEASETNKRRILDESNVLNSQVLTLVERCQELERQREILVERCQELERQREILVERLEAHRDAFRVVVNTLTKVGAKDPNTDGLQPT